MHTFVASFPLVNLRPVPGAAFSHSMPSRRTTWKALEPYMEWFGDLQGPAGDTELHTRKAGRLATRGA
eukprot:4565699-Prymnesium_polylepis.1